MKKARKRSTARRSSNGMRAEYDFRGGVRGKYASRYEKGANVVLIAPDVAEEFPTARAVNRALRELLKLKSKRRTA
jgi:hypothetical protein